jgi:preprotein translocase subunit SecF
MSNTKAKDLKKNGVYALLIGVVLETIYLAFLSNSDNAISSMLGVAIGVSGPIIFIVGIVLIIKGFISKE